MRIGVAGILALWAVGCASATRRDGSRDTLRAMAAQERFPSRDDLARLASMPGPPARRGGAPT
jgi:hypothetical protein